VSSPCQRGPLGRFLQRSSLFLLLLWYLCWRGLLRFRWNCWSRCPANPRSLHQLTSISNLSEEGRRPRSGLFLILNNLCWNIHLAEAYVMTYPEFSTRCTYPSSSICAWSQVQLSCSEYIVYMIIWPIVILFKQLQIWLIKSVSIYLIDDLLIWSIYSCSGRSTTWSCILSRWRIQNRNDWRSLKIA
jgi:hypothetical protein